MQYMRAFHHSSKAFLLGGVESWELHCHNIKLKILEPDFTPPPPISLSDPYFVANIRSNIYLFAHVHSEGFWVLKSGTWDSLSAPALSPVDPTFRRAYIRDSPWCQWFISDDKLFLLASYLPGKEEIVVYDPQSAVWEKVDDKDTHFQLSSFDLHSITTISVPDVCNNCSVALTFRGGNIRGGEFVNIKLYALLLDKQTNLVRCCQSLDECSNQIQVQQSKVWWYSPSMKCVDLGNGMVCALIIGSTKLRCHADLEPLLWILVFTLVWTQEDQRFLYVVDVSVNQIYTRHLANPKETDCLHSAFIVTPKDFSTAFVEQKDSLNKRMEVQAQLPRTYTMKDILGELQNMKIYMEGRLQSIETSLARQQDAIDHLCTHFGILNRCGIILHPRTS
ncbi:uncharacterized protein LOC107488616 [Arachis duranensis]|uniref:Uncharacterized protein LOC107488616 n=1 Tax=Arachis duranensis TaxID=130453 RepID=A0A6P4DA67_ARADU|nr:uncharacterized protein LOC107488616 [Arachis duranensis]